MIVVEVKIACKRIDGNSVPENISVTMESGKIYGFQGINGSDKTMLMRLIIGLIHPT